MTTYGIGYKGSKNKIAKDIIEFLPEGERLVDLFGGGFAISHCACLSNKWKRILYNDINPLIVDTIKKAINGDYNENKFKPEFITREKFFELKGKDGIMQTCWSFGNNCKSYLYSSAIEPYKHACHQAIVFNEWEMIRNLCPEIYEAAYKALNGTASTRQRRLKFGPAVVKELKCLNNWQLVQDNPLYKSCHWRGGFNNINKSQDLQSLQSLERLERLTNLSELPIANLECTCNTYKEYKYLDGDIVYCDIPYESTSGYNYNFDHK